MVSRRIRRSSPNWVDGRQWFPSPPAAFPVPGRPFRDRQADGCHRAQPRGALSAGARIVCGTDAGVGPNKPHDVLRYAVSGFLPAIGMSNAEALQANTSVAADVYGLGERKGTIEAGKDADIIAVPGNPIDDITCLQRILAVIVAGNQIGSPS